MNIRPFHQSDSARPNLDPLGHDPVALPVAQNTDDRPSGEGELSHGPSGYGPIAHGQSCHVQSSLSEMNTHLPGGPAGNLPEPPLAGQTLTHQTQPHETRSRETRTQEIQLREFQSDPPPVDSGVHTPRPVGSSDTAQFGTSPPRISPMNASTHDDDHLTDGALNASSPGVSPVGDAATGAASGRVNSMGDAPAATATNGAAPNGATPARVPVECPWWQKELGSLLEAVCEERLTEAEHRRLEQILLTDAGARSYYLTYIDLHGALHWDMAVAVSDEEDAVAALVDAAIVRLAHPEEQSSFFGLEDDSQSVDRFAQPRIRCQDLKTSSEITPERAQEETQEPEGSRASFSDLFQLGGNTHDKTGRNNASRNPASRNPASGNQAGSNHVERRARAGERADRNLRPSDNVRTGQDRRRDPQSRGGKASKAGRSQRGRRAIPAENSVSPVNAREPSVNAREPSLGRTRLTSQGATEPAGRNLGHQGERASTTAFPFNKPLVRRASMGVAAALLVSLGVWIGNLTAKSNHGAAALSGLAKEQSPLPGPQDGIPSAGPGVVDQSLTGAASQTLKPETSNAVASPHKFGADEIQLAHQTPTFNGSPTDSAVSTPVENKPSGAANGVANGVANNVTSHALSPENQNPTDPVLEVSDAVNRAPVSMPSRQPGHSLVASTAASSSEIIGYVNGQLKESWLKAEVSPSAKADDTEWLRRLHLDLLGHIPPVAQYEKFLANRSPSKRAAEIDRLLDHPAFARNFATIWTNLLVGRAPREEVNRQALATFLRQNFGRNRPWQEIVFDLVAAEGRTDQNGAANFLVAHLNGGAIPATGITSRLFLGAQLQCAQCHNHPFSDSKQEQFWAFNSFFQQAVVVRIPKYDAKTGQMLVAGIELATKDVDGPVYYETRNGLMKVAYPAFGSSKIDPRQVSSRRRELARLMTQNDDSGLAPAFVNRLWAHFHGRAFTPVVDDMGPHVAPSHPQLLDRLSEEFVRSGYDVKQLIRWICNSESYQLTSRFGDQNGKDNPETGEPPLFSHMYVKPLNPEQLYDSLVVATQGQLAGGPTLDQSDKTRDAWLKQFVVSFETEENDETSTLNGSITQSLLMMNGDLMRNATEIHKGTWLNKLLTSKENETERIQALFTAALSRPATARELAGVKKILKHGSPPAKNGPTNSGGNLHAEQAYQDIYWALLNSNEFILNH